MKRTIASLLGLLFCLVISAQAYRGITIAPEPERITIYSFKGIEISSIAYGSDGTYSVTLMNQNYNNSGERNSYNFQWYLSYKGKRVSDYYNSTIKCREQITVSKVLAWPGSVPKGYESYVTVQLGKESSNSNGENSKASYTPTAKKVEIESASSIRAATTNFRSMKWLNLTKEGLAFYGENNSQGDAVVERNGSYVIDTENKIHFVWDNGFEDVGTLSYQSAQRAIIQYNGYTLYQILESDYK